MNRRAELAEMALDYVLANGLVGLSLRPLAAALDTSDRMLIYHFGSKEQLVDTVIEQAQRRLAESLGEPGQQVGGLADLIDHLWATLTTPAAAQVTRLYLETCVLAVDDPQRWGTTPERLRGPWREPLRDGLVTFGVAPHRAGALATLILDTFDGLALDRLTTTDPARVDAAAAAFGSVLAAGAAASSK